MKSTLGAFHGSLDVNIRVIQKSVEMLNDKQIK